MNTTLGIWSERTYCASSNHAGGAWNQPDVTIPPRAETAYTDANLKDKEPYSKRGNSSLGPACPQHAKSSLNPFQSSVTLFFPINRVIPQIRLLNRPRKINGSAASSSALITRTYHREKVQKRMSGSWSALQLTLLGEVWGKIFFDLSDIWSHESTPVPIFDLPINIDQYMWFLVTSDRRCLFICCCAELYRYSIPKNFVK